MHQPTLQSSRMDELGMKRVKKKKKDNSRRDGKNRWMSTLNKWIECLYVSNPCNFVTMCKGLLDQYIYSIRGRLAQLWVARCSRHRYYTCDGNGDLSCLCSRARVVNCQLMFLTVSNACSTHSYISSVVDARHGMLSTPFTCHFC